MEHIGVVSTLVVAMILLFISMVLSSMSSSAYQQGDSAKGQKMAMWTAITDGLSLLGLAVALGLVYYKGSESLSYYY